MVNLDFLVSQVTADILDQAYPAILDIAVLEYLVTADFLAQAVFQGLAELAVTQDILVLLV